MKEHKIVWVENIVHHEINIEAAKNGMRVGKFINRVLKQYLKENGTSGI